MLVSAALAGDRTAFAQLYERHLEAVYRYLYYRTRVVEEAEDMTSEVFTRTLDLLPRYQPTRPFRAFLYGVARNVWLEHIRKAGRNLSDFSTRPTASDQPGPAESSLNRDRASIVRNLILQLTPLQQEVVVLCHVEGLSYTEAGAVLRKPASTVRGIQMRALEALRKLIAEDGRGL